MAHGYTLEAQYQDGFVHTEDHNDQSLYSEGHNVYYDIVNHLPESEHGPLVRFSAVGRNRRYDIDWTKVPAGAEPVYSRDMAHEFNMATGETAVYAERHRFGYTNNVKELTA